MLDMVEELLQKGIELHKSGKVKVASQHYTAILKVQPEHPDANHNMGVLAVGLGKIKEALPFFETALEANADTSQFWLSYIDALIKVERMADAQAVLNQAKNNGAEGAGFDQLELRLNVPNQAELETSNKALKAHQSQPNILDTLKLDQALRLAKKKSQAGTTKEAQRIYQDILTKFPKNKRAINGLKGLADTPVGNASKVQDPPLDQLQALIDLYSQGQPQRALKQAETLVQQFPKSPVLFNIQGTVLKSLRQFDLSFAAFNKALAIKPEYADAYNNMGNAFQEQGKLEEAVEAYKKVLAIKPDYADAYNNMGTALKDQGKLEEAIEAYNEALAIKPDYAEAYNNMGITLQEQGKLDEAIEAYNKALAIKPDYADTYYNMGNALKEQGKLDEAIEAYNKALTIKPDYAETYYNMGVTLQEQGKLEEAIEAYNKALSLKPDYAHAQAQKLHQKAQICHWPVIDAYRFNFEELGIVGESILPFTLLSLDDSPERQLNRAEKYIKANNQQKPLKMAENRVGSSHYSKSKLNQNNVARRIPNRIKVGYFSPIFHQNPVSILSSRMLELHDTEKFEIFIFVYKKMINDQYCARLIKSGAKIIDVSKKSDKQIAELAMEKGIDLAIEFNGFLKNGRQGILAHRPAPVQINYLAYPGTMGADFYDYIIGDHVVIPEDQKHNYAENIIYLPDCYMPHDNTRQISNKPISRAECGLPDNRFVFCCFNNSFKISPQEFDIWMRLLNKIEGSVLWLLKANEWSQNNLRNEASKRGVDADRLVFADKLPLEEHLGRLRHADLFLDTFNFNAHTTASDALWAGIPVVTKIGKSFAARVAGSLLNAIELPELITTTEKEYEALALSLASNPKTLTLIKKKLAEKKNSAPLFDTETYTKNLERAYIQAYQRYADGLPPAELNVL
jgi:protein O-GlcNAc transferase